MFLAEGGQRFLEQRVVRLVAGNKLLPVLPPGFVVNVAEPGILAAPGVGRHLRDFDQAGLNGINQRIVADNPFHGRSVSDHMNGGGGHIHHIVEQAGVPQVGQAVEPTGVPGRPAGVAAMAMVRFIVDDHNPPMGVGLAVGDARRDFRRGFCGRRLLPGRGIAAAVQQVAGVFARRVSNFLRIQLLLVGDAHLRLVQSLLPFLPRRQDAELGIIVLRAVGGQPGFQPFPDGQPRSQQQEAADEARVIRVGAVIGDLPEDEHSHSQGLAGAGSHLVGDAGNAIVKLVVNGGQFPDDVRRGDFLQVDVRQNGVQLGEVKAVVLPVGVGAGRPVPDEAAGSFGDAGAALLLPGGHPVADAVDQLQLRPLDAQSLRFRLPHIAGAGDGGQILGAAPAGQGRADGPGLPVELPVPFGLPVRGVDNRFVFRHGRLG